MNDRDLPRVCALGRDEAPLHAVAERDNAVRAPDDVSADSIEHVLDAYEATRKPRTSAVQAGSSANTWMRNATNPDWLYGYDPWAAPLGRRGRSVRCGP